ncbi:hypothetical protein [Peptostreptococcus equinus]|uniref:IrrE N-terminal-like domain-containing protein n=1 Tax=Peptostreptococcus equinus TaxID=3003601 RepID=A0ABY7JQJ7_9FIRM|nr:hypothetical protein [Peptostreptococcus sp. CBA3647]WAW14774.1 hypothetical protein O0R46_09340 [Peptostreptococcus sp. CBA3647]
MTIEKINSYIENNNINIDNCDRLNFFGKSALYCNIYNKDLILLSPDFYKKLSSEQLEILAEECGHHATSVGDTFINTDLYYKKLEVSKSEKKAILWATNYIIDEYDLKKYIKQSCSVEELTSYLGITEEFLYEYLYCKRNKIHYLDLGDNKILDLYKLPNLHIMERSEINETT